MRNFSLTMKLVLLGVVVVAWSGWVGCATPPCGVGGGLYGECVPPGEPVPDQPASDAALPDLPPVPQTGCACAKNNPTFPHSVALWLLLLTGFWVAHRRPSRKKTHERETTSKRG